MDKYLLREYLVPLIYCLLTFCMMFVIYDLFDHLSKFIDAQTPPLMVGRYYFCILVPTLEYLMPASLLLATLYTLWHLTRHNELTAMRAGGVSLYRIMMPFLGVALAFSLLTAAIKEIFAPRAGMWASQFVSAGLREPAQTIYRGLVYYNSSARRLWQVKKLDLKEPHRLSGVTVKHEREDGSTAEKIFTEKAEWLDGHWWFYGAQVRKYNANERPVDEPKVLPPVKEMRDLTETPTDIVSEVKPWEFLSSLEMVRYLESHKDLTEKTVAGKKFDLHSRLAMPWACFIVTLFGIPAGARSGRQSALTGVFMAVAFFFAFYALMQIGLFLGKRQLIAPWLGAWLSNFVFLTIGLFMVARMR